MALTVLPSRPCRQPYNGTALINWAHPLAKGLALAFIGSDAALRTNWRNIADRANNAVPSTGTPFRERTRLGWAAKNNDGTGTFRAAWSLTKAAVNANPSSAFVLLHRNQSTLNTIASGGSTDQWFIDGSNQVNFRVASSTRFISTKTILIGTYAAIGFTGGNGGYSGYINGVQDGTDAGGFGNFSMFDKLCGGGSASQSLDSILLLLQWYGRNLTPSEHLRLALAPWQLFMAMRATVAMTATAATFQPGWARSANTAIYGGALVA